MTTLKNFLDNCRILKKKNLIICEFQGVVTFHVAHHPENAVKRDAEFCSPNAVAEICIEKLGVELTSSEVIEISNFC